MSSEEFDRYDNRCMVLQKLILKEYPNDAFDFHRNRHTLLVEVVINDRANITLLPDSKWKDIKRHINKKITRSHISTECQLCYETIYKNVSCPKCAFNYCGMCYIKLFETGRGIITCPNCRFSVGDTCTDIMIKNGVKQIKSNLGI